MLGRLFDPLAPATRWVLAAGAIARAGVLCMGAVALDRAFVVDDAYYTLTIARSLAEHGVPSASGTELTTGFQPLLALLELPAFLAGASPDAGLLWGLSILLIADWLVAVLLARLATRVAGPTAGFVAACWALSPLALREALVGLEAPLATATTLAAVALLERVDQDRRRARPFLAGAMLGAALLARIDTALFVALVGLWLLRKHRAALLPVTLGAALVAGPWLGFCFAVTGRPWPESGTAVRALIGEGGTVASVARCAGWAAGYVAPGGLVDFPELRVWFVAHPVSGALACVATLVAAGLAASRVNGAARAWVLGTFALVPFYVLYLPAIWGFHRYLLPARAAMTLSLALLVAKLSAHLSERLRPWLGRAAVAVFVPTSALATFVALRSPPIGGIDRSTGYRAVALAIHAALPGGSTVGAFQSGALGYFRPAGTGVVNLDGVVSRAAHRAYVERRLDDVLRARGVTHLADWGAGLKEIRARSRGHLLLRPFFAAPPQGSFRFLLTPVEWAN